MRGSLNGEICIGEFCTGEKNRNSNYEMLRTEIFYSFIDEVHYTPMCIVRPVKRDWAVLSKDTPLDISI